MLMKLLARWILKAMCRHPFLKALSLDFISSDFSCGCTFSMVLSEEWIFFDLPSNVSSISALSGICRQFSCWHGRIWLMRWWHTALCSFFQSRLKCWLDSTLQWKTSKTHRPFKPLILASLLFTGASCCRMWPWLVFADSRPYEPIFLSHAELK